MGRALELRRMHGTHNAFALLDARGDVALSSLDFPTLARSASSMPNDRRDGLLVVLDDDSALARMRMFNPDGSEAEMCGNGMRCVARVLVETGAPPAFVVASGAGPVRCTLLEREPFAVRLELGAPELAADDAFVAALGTSWRFRFVSLGNPHAVVVLERPDDVAHVSLPELAAAFAHDARFPQGINVHVMAKASPERIAVRHFERGVGETQACGTGSVASAVVAIARGFVTSPVEVDVPGGTLVVTWAPGERATLAGPAIDEGTVEFAFASA